MKKVNFLTTFAVVVSFVSGLTSCSMQKNEDAVLPAPQVRTDTITNVLDNILTWDGITMYYNKQQALTAYVTPDSLTLNMPKAQHAASTIDGADNRWLDSNGNGFTGAKIQNEVDGLILTADIIPADPFSTLIPIHEKVSMVKGKFNLVGMATFEETGKSKSFELPVESGTYFLCDTSVTVKVITETEIEIRDSITTEYVHIYKDLVIVNGFGFGSITFVYGEKSFEFRMDLDSLSILREESGWGKATKTDENVNGFDLNDNQHGKYTVKENGIKLESVSLAKSEIPFVRLNDTFKYGTTSINVKVSFKNESGEDVERDFQVSASYFHELKVEKKPDDVTPVVTDHTYDVDTVRSTVKDSDGHITGEKMRVTIKKDGEAWYKAQYMIWETGLANPTLTGTQVGDNKMLRPTTFGTPEEFHAEGWWGEENLKGATTTAYSLQYKFRTAFKAVPGFGQSEESVAETNLVFGKRDFHITDAETGWELSIPAGDLNVIITEDFVGSDEAAKADVNSRGLEYEYIGTHYLSFDQYVGGVKVNSQSRAENLLYPKN